MPYIDYVSRLRVLPEEAKRLVKPETAGELNFVLTTIIIEYLRRIGHSYKSYNEVMGVLECAKQELYRRVIAQYEDHKKNDNGEVYR